MKNKITEKSNVCVCLFIIPSKVLYCFKCPKIILANFLTQKNPLIFDHPCHLKSGLSPPGTLCECEIKIDHHTGIVNSVWVPLTSYRIYYMSQACETVPTVYRPYLWRRLERITFTDIFLNLDWATEITCLFSSPLYVQPICTCRIFTSQIHPATPLSEVKWLTSNKLFCCWPVSWCLFGVRWVH